MHSVNMSLAFVAIFPLRLTPSPRTKTASQFQTPAERQHSKHITFTNRTRILPKCTQTIPPPRTRAPATNPNYKKPSATPQLIAQGDSLQSTPEQQLYLAAFALASLATFAQVGTLISTPLDALSDLSAIFAAYIFTDFAVGVYHHAVDNYGSKHTPFVGYQIDAFQGHHKYPWTITARDMPNNLYRLTKITLPQLCALLLLPIPHQWQSFYSAFLFFIVLSQETHRQAHMTRAAPWVRALQQAGVIVSPKAHAAHHKSSAAYEGNYCILSGWWNRVLDRSGFFRFVEAVVFCLTGNEPICWRLDSSLKYDALRTLPRTWRETL